MVPHETVYHVMYGTQNLWGYLNLRSMTLCKSNTRHSWKTGFSVVAYCLNFKYFSVYCYVFVLLGHQVSPTIYIKYVIS